MPSANAIANRILFLYFSVFRDFAPASVVVYSVGEKNNFFLSVTVCFDLSSVTDSVIGQFNTSSAERADKQNDRQVRRARAAKYGHRA